MPTSALRVRISRAVLGCRGHSKIHSVAGGISGLTKTTPEIHDAYAAWNKHRHLLNPPAQIALLFKHNHLLPGFKCNACNDKHRKHWSYLFKLSGTPLFKDFADAMTGYPEGWVLSNDDFWALKAYADTRIPKGDLENARLVLVSRRATPIVDNDNEKWTHYHSYVEFKLAGFRLHELNVRHRI